MLFASTPSSEVRLKNICSTYDDWILILLLLVCVFLLGLAQRVPEGLRRKARTLQKIVLITAVPCKCLLRIFVPTPTPPAAALTTSVEGDDVTTSSATQTESGDSLTLIWEEQTTPTARVVLPLTAGGGGVKADAMGGRHGRLGLTRARTSSTDLATDADMASWIEDATSDIDGKSNDGSVEEREGEGGRVVVGGGGRRPVGDPAAAADAFTPRDAASISPQSTRSQSSPPLLSAARIGRARASSAPVATTVQTLVWTPQHTVHHEQVLLVFSLFFTASEKEVAAAAAAGATAGGGRRDTTVQFQAWLNLGDLEGVKFGEIDKSEMVFAAQTAARAGKVRQSVRVLAKV